MQATKSPAPAVLEKVPPFPPVAAKLLGVLARADVEVREVAQLIGSDATFTARLLRCVNSYEFGLTSPVTNVQQAVALAGLDRTRQITMTQAAAVYAQGALRTGELRRCWQHSIATAVLADEIAQACGVFTDAAFTAGIMHDIGRLGLLVAYPDRYERIIRDAAAQCLDLLDFEQEEFGVNHTEAGRYLAEKWGLPEDLRTVAGRHHDPSEGAELDLLRLVRVACRLADSLGYDVTRPLVPTNAKAALKELPLAARQRFRKSPEQLRALIEKQILEFSFDPTQIALDPLPEQNIADETTAVDEAPVEEQSVEIELPGPPSEVRSHSIVLTVAWTVAVIAGLAALLLWKLR
ncbi:MAG: HDOD domain-containing protein [Acidobacteriia bacterium]|nr:HDOD domain-containing protein [Terriglobia bacterium]